MSLVVDVFSGVDVQTMLFGIVFVIILALLMFLLGRVKLFQQNQGTKVIVAICISLLAVYGIIKSRWDLEGVFYGFGFGADMIYNLVLVAIVAFFIIISITRDELDRKIIVFRIYRPMIILGIIFIALKFSPWANGDRMLYVGIPLLLIGLILWNRKRIKTTTRRKNAQNYHKI